MKRHVLTKWSQLSEVDQTAMAQHFAAHLRDARHRLGATVRDVRRESGLSLGFLSDLEHGRRWATYEVAWRLESALDRLAAKRGAK